MSWITPAWIIYLLIGAVYSFTRLNKNEAFADKLVGRLMGVWKNDNFTALIASLILILRWPYAIWLRLAGRESE